MATPNETWRIGDTELTTIVEAETAGIPAALFYPDIADDHLAASTDWMVEGAVGDDMTITFRVQAFLLRHRGLTVVVDPCVGNHKNLAMPFWAHQDLPWMEHLIEAGVTPDQVDLVIHTHLHEDHIGWDTHLVEGEWVPTFPNARHVYVGNELEWASSEKRRQIHDAFSESIAPVFDAGLSWEVDGDADLGDGLRLLSTPGHTPGHSSLEVETGSERLVITGDVLHHPFQFAAPDVAEVGDQDPDRARTVRCDLFADLADSDAVVAGTHFPIASVGRVETHAGAWRWGPISS